MPYAFTEQGVAMLRGISNRDGAININIPIMRAFVETRKALLFQAFQRKLEDRERIAFRKRKLFTARMSNKRTTCRAKNRCLSTRRRCLQYGTVVKGPASLF